MLPERIVRAHRDNLKRIIDAPCTCVGLAILVCEANREKNRLTLAHLDWILELSGDLERFVEATAKIAGETKPEARETR